VVVCLEHGTDLHMAQLMPVPLTVSCFSKIRISFTYLVPAHPGSPRKRGVERVCLCVCHIPTDVFHTRLLSNPPITKGKATGEKGKDSTHIDRRPVTVTTGTISVVHSAHSCNYMVFFQVSAQKNYNYFCLFNVCLSFTR